MSIFDAAPNSFPYFRNFSLLLHTWIRESEWEMTIFGTKYQISMETRKPRNGSN